MLSEKILFVGKTEEVDRPFLDPSTRYRCFNIAYALKKRGHRTEVVTLSYFLENIEIAKNFEHIVFHRPFLNDEGFIRFLQENQYKKNLIADFDDLIFDVSNILNLPEISTRDPSIRGTSQYISKNAAACHFFKKFSVSTQPLANKLSTLFPDAYVRVISNTLGSEYVDLSRKLFLLNKRREYKLGYFPGTASHNNDFQKIAHHIAKFLSQNKKDKIFILGPLKIPASLNAYYNRIDHIPNLVPFNHLPYIKANVETILAPLGENEFNVCKSGLKFFEAMPLGCRVIATAIPDIDRFDSSYLDKCYTIEDWGTLLDNKKVDRSKYEAELDSMLNKVGSDHVAKIWEESFLS
ncbi:MAG: hypothetical protein QM578_10010 [Pantoea sp.]|uniref:hypothetical protein n=1 Tax=Pantoea sp. TaxID=69393 RepID=UPI0039E39528